MSINEIKANLKKGNYKLIDKTNAKSEVWNNFKLVVNENEDIVKDVAACKLCMQVLIYHSHKTGTSSLRKHRCSNSAACSTRPISSYFGKTSALKLPTKEEKSLVTKMAVKYVCKDLRAFQSVAGEGFTEIAQCLIDIGSRSGRVDAKELLPDPTTVSRNIKIMAAEVKTKLIPELKVNLNEAVGAVTLDMWTDDYRKIGYLCLTLHYIENTWCLKERVLCTSQWDSTLKKTGENIKSAVIQSLRKFDLEEFFPKLIYVTDRGANMIASLKNVTRLNCSAHLINTILHHAFQFKHEENEEQFVDIQNVINGGKSLVTYFKQSNLQNSLKKTLKAPVETRWNSLYMMFESIHTQYDQIKDILVERSEEHRLDDLNCQLVENIFKFLERFRQASDALEASSKPTLHLAIVWFKRLERHLKPSLTDNIIISELKTKCLGILNEKFKPHLLHKIALFMHPKLKSLKLLETESEKTDVKNEVKRLLNENKERSELHQQEDKEFQATSYGKKRKNQDDNPDCKRRKKDDDLTDVEDSSDDNLEPEPDEFEMYLKFKLNQMDEDFDLLLWWKTKADIFPNISTLARSILSIPASSAASERDFSTAGYVIQERRTQLNPDTVDDILFLHSNL